MTLGNIKCFGYVCFASEPISSVSMVSESIVSEPICSESLFPESIFWNPFFRDPCFRNPFFFSGSIFIGIHFFRNPFFRNSFFLNPFLFGIHFRHLGKNEKNENCENSCVSFLCGNGRVKILELIFFGATHFGVFVFLAVVGRFTPRSNFGGWFGEGKGGGVGHGSDPTRDHCCKHFEQYVCLCQTHIPEIKLEGACARIREGDGPLKKTNKVLRRPRECNSRV